MVLSGAFFDRPVLEVAHDLLEKRSGIYSDRTRFPMVCFRPWENFRPLTPIQVNELMEYSFLIGERFAVSE